MKAGSWLNKLAPKLSIEKPNLLSPSMKPKLAANLVLPTALFGRDMYFENFQDSDSE